MPNIRGTSGNDTLYGTIASDVIEGLEGNDTLIDSLGGDDQLFGGPNSDGITVTRSPEAAPSTILIDGGTGYGTLTFDGGTRRLDSVTIFADPQNTSFMTQSQMRINVTGAATAAITSIGTIDFISTDSPGTMNLDTGRDVITLTGAWDYSNGNILTIQRAGARFDEWLLYLTGFLKEATVGWTEDQDPFDTHFLRLAIQGSNHMIQIDRDGDANGRNYVTFLIVEPHFSGMRPDGYYIDGMNYLGTPGDDFLAASGTHPSNSYPNGLEGFEGNDQLFGAGVGDGLDGGPGNDHLEGRGGNDYMDGGTGDDVLLGGEGNDIMFGRDGSDHLRGDRDNDYLSGGDGDDYIDGGDYNDGLYGGSGNDIMLGGAGEDGLYGEDGDDYMDGGDLRDYLDGGSGRDGLYGGAGDDIAFGGADDDGLHGGDGNDYLNGGDGRDYLDGGLGKDGLYAGVGDDIVFGGAGDDGLYGEDGNDYLDAGDGADYLNGGLGNDVLLGGAGIDYMLGGDGNDYVNGGTEDDILFGEVGDDGLHGGDGADYLNGGDGIDYFDGGAGNDGLYGGNGADILFGMAGDDGLHGEVGDDYLNGGEGADYMTGGSGNDSLDGGAGTNILTGGDGSDAFLFMIAPGFGFSHVLDFTMGADRIVLDDAAFGLPIGALSPDAFRTGAAAQDADDRIIYNPATGALIFDVDGSGSAAPVQIATLPNQLPLAASDFFVM